MNAIGLASSATVKARAFKAGLSDSAVASASFTVHAAATAAFVAIDSWTHGNWKGRYGTEGYNISGDTVNYPSYAQVTTIGKSDNTCAASSSELRTLQKANSTTDRIAAGWVALDSFAVDLNLTDGQTHQVAFYMLDWNAWGRVQGINVLDATSGALLDSVAVGEFDQGDYLVLQISGHVILQFTDLYGASLKAALNGLFFDPPDGAPPLVGHTIHRLPLPVAELRARPQHSL